MKEFYIYAHPNLDTPPQIVKKGFCWPAFFLGPIWAWVNGMVGVGFALFGMAALFTFVEAVTAVNSSWWCMLWVACPVIVSVNVGTGVAWVGAICALLVGIFVGLNGNKWRSNHLRKKGYELFYEFPVNFTDSVHSWPVFAKLFAKAIGGGGREVSTEGYYVNGKRHGQWFIRSANGNVKHRTFLNGVRVEERVVVE